MPQTLGMKAINIALFASVAAIFAKLVLFQINAEYQYTVYANILFLLIAIFFGIRQGMIENNGATTYMNDVKSGARTAAIFAVIIAIFAYVYYNNINPEFLQQKIDERMVLVENITPQEIETLKSEGKIAQELTKEDLINKELENTQNFYSPFFYATLSLIGYLLVGIVYSLFLSLILRNAPGFKR